MNYSWPGPPNRLILYLNYSWPGPLVLFRCVVSLPGESIFRNLYLFSLCSLPVGELIFKLVPFPFGVCLRRLEDRKKNDPGFVEACPICEINNVHSFGSNLQSDVFI